LWQELITQGFTGNSNTVYRDITVVRKQLGVPVAQLPRSIPHATYEFTPRRLVALVLSRSETLSTKQKQLITQSELFHPDIAHTTALAQAFAAMVRSRSFSLLDP